jgi:MYXO-CTERM domain-containing protein
MRQLLRSLPSVLAGLVVLPLTARLAQAATYYVAPSGSDANAGTLAAPFGTAAKGQAVAAPGDTIYFRGGTYAFTAAATTCASSTSTVNGVLLDKSGASGNRINYWAYPGEVPVFDFAGIKDGCRITGFHVKASWVHLKGLTVTGVPQNVNTNHESWGVYVNGGSNDVFEQLDLHHNMGPGLFIIKGGNNLVVNCDSHENYDPLSSSGAGGNSDGFGCHVPVGDTGNVFRGCRAWWNSDDGWDLISAKEVVVIESSWSWYNGYLPGTMTASGDGNGFKAGGYGLPATDVPPNPPVHVVQKCLAFFNRAAGFYVNHHPVADRFYNNTSYNNHPNFNLLGVAADGNTGVNIALLRNNIAFGGTLLSNNTGPQIDEANNSWNANLGVTVTAADFQDLSITGMDGPRLADGSLPNVSNFHLAATSDLLDKGVNVGLPYVGVAPDLGAFEHGDTGTNPDAGGTGGAAGSAGAAGSGGMDAGRLDASGSGGTGGGSGGVAGAGGAGGQDAGRAGASGSNGGGGIADAGSGAGRGGAAGASVADSGTTTGTGGATGGNAGTSNGGAGLGGGAGASVSGGSAGAGSQSVSKDAGGCSCRVANREGDAKSEVLLLALAGMALGRPMRRRRWHR